MSTEQAPSRPKKNTEITLTIDRLVYGGKGIGQTEQGFKVFVADTAPGDKVLARVTKVKSKYAEARLLEVLEPSPLRVAPRCKHFDTCGGCKWQFLPYEKQCEVKEQQVKDAVERLAELSPELVLPIIPNAEPWFYRNKMELSFGPGAERPDGSREAMLGFYPPGYHYEVFNLEECFLQSEWMGTLVQKVRDFANAHRIPVYRSDTHEGLLRNLIIREAKNTDEVMVILVTSTGVFEYEKEFIALFDDEPKVSSLYWNTIYQVPGQPTWIEEKLLKGKPTLTEVLRLENGQELSFDILPQAFFQTNTKQAEVLYSKVVELAELSGQEVVFDLYCGTGTIGLFCAHKAKQVVGIEVNESAVENARANARHNNIKNATFYLGSVDKRLAAMQADDALVKPDVLIVDPPRSGLGETVVEQCVSFGSPKIVYVSCNSTTMARDLKQFAELGYKTLSVQPVDMFPQTSHMECVSLLVKK